MNILLKLTLPIFIAFLIFSCIIHFYWADKVYENAFNDLKKQTTKELIALENDLIRNLLSKNYSAMFSSLDKQINNNKETWLEFHLYDDNNKHIYPLYPKHMSIDNNDLYIPIKYPLKLKGETIGMIKFYLNLDIKYLETEERIQELEQITFFTLFLLLIVVLLIQLKFIRLPLLKLEKIANNISKGNFDKPINISSHDEFGQLGLAFNTMQNNLASMHQSLIQAKNEANKSSESKSEFLANMSHEIRTPLNAINGFIELLKKQNKDESLIEYLNIITNSSKNLNQVIDDILDFSKIESGKLNIELVDFSSMDEFKTITYLFDAKSAEKSISLQLEIADNLPKYLKSDPFRIKQVISNLLSNAIKFSPSNKKILVSINYIKSYLTVSVKDQGLGIAQDKLELIFGAFNQADNSTTREYGGTGLGLAISSHLIKLLGGEIKVKSKIGEGSEFYFSIPVDAGQKVEEKPLLVKDIDTQNFKLLLVEDDTANQLLMKFALANFKLDYDLAGDGVQAVEHFKNSVTCNSKYDLILMDENMPNMNGIEATRKIREYEQLKKLKHTPIIALTANTLKGDRERFLAAGMDDFLSKPAELKTLKATIYKFV